MSSKQEISKKIISLLNTLPKEKLKHYSSFKDTQIKRFSDLQKVNQISEQDLKLQYIALKNLCNDKYQRYYELDDKLLRPKGNPHYYERLMNEINGEKKENLFSALRTVVFGK
ncbi:cytochrome b pre-mRNA-processing protein, putative [Candida dubliniensis CD36]|uniref:Cytochrome b pre-mRNA-processing protein, putative n=1 Tax=Candida dubliniensis (strain CD36 / ATCC MYA-646 / CBS 7987 / NCPF 3949 / NRRL Y-17841) TaxID=573826 RepID=B9WC64_CANDC|nr:cytochrome b pre-mRNA-processing protein, putative [Candida dubliniensis CD36]CAX43986.1 cytochrome b pre-mRNA-processing protein, putative [Candida dubliniensis CD36]